MEELKIHELSDAVEKNVLALLLPQVKEFIEIVQKNVLAVVTSQVAQSLDATHNSTRVYEERVDNKFVILEVKIEGMMLKTETSLKKFIEDEYVHELEEFEKRLNECLAKIQENSARIQENSASIQRLDNKILSKVHIYFIYPALALVIAVIIVLFRRESKINDTLFRIETYMQQKTEENQSYTEKTMYLIDELIKEREQKQINSMNN